MKPIIRLIKFYLGIFFQLILAVAVFLVGWGMSFTSIDLNNVPNISGTIISTSLEQNKGSKAVTGQMNLVVHLENEVNGFWIYRSSQNYSDILSRLLAGNKVTIYHDKHPNSNGYTVYQLENNEGIIYSKTEYEKKEKLAGRFIALPGAFILLGTIIFQIRKRYKMPLPI